MKEELLLLRNQLKMGHRISFAEAMLLQRAIDILVNKAGNYPAIPDGYVMVPKEPTKEMIDAGWLHYMSTKNPSSKGTYKAMLAAAPQSPGSEPATVPGKWIPVSEQMPDREVDVQVYCPDKKEQMVAYLERNELEGYFRFATWRTGDGIYCQPTHWMQLPAGPQEVTDGK